MTASGAAKGAAVTRPPVDVPPAPTTANRVGFVLATGLALLDTTALLSGVSEGDENGPVDPVLVVTTGLGVVTLVAVWFGWVRRSRAGARAVAVSRVLATILSLPAFFVDGVPPALVASVSVLSVAAAASAVLVLLPPRPAQD